MFMMWIVLGGIYLAAIVALMSFDKGRRSVALGLRSLWLHKMRAFLSVLGIIIGTAAVVSLMAFGEGSMQDTLDDIKRQGATNIIIRSVKPQDDGSTQRRSFVAAYGLTYDDLERFESIGVVTRSVPMRIFPQEVRHLERMHNCRLVATTQKYTEVNQLELISGRFLSEEDDYLMLNVAVLAAKVADKLFPFDNPLDQTVRVGPHFYRVIGVLKDRMPTGGSGGSQAAEDFNNDVYIPLQTCRVRVGEVVYIRQSGSRSGEKVQLNQITLTVSDMDKVRPVGDLIRQMLAEHHLREDYAVTVPLDRLEEAEKRRSDWTQLLALIASISLIVGGIGIMNIMLATVTERTREIGIRRALGAKRRDITLQFLVEAVVQTMVGGVLGLVVGLGIVFLAPPLIWLLTQTPRPAQINMPSIVLSQAVAVTVGILFGLYPARRAALLDPIEALRHS